MGEKGREGERGGETEKGKRGKERESEGEREEGLRRQLCWYMLVLKHESLSLIPQNPCKNAGNSGVHM